MTSLRNSIEDAAIVFAGRYGEHVEAIVVSSRVYTDLANEVGRGFDSSLFGGQIEVRLDARAPSDTVQFVFASTEAA